jgi:hypothetical protein
LEAEERRPETSTGARWRNSFSGYFFLPPATFSRKYFLLNSFLSFYAWQAAVVPAQLPSSSRQSEPVPATIHPPAPAGGEGCGASMAVPKRKHSEPPSSTSCSPMGGLLPPSPALTMAALPPSPQVYPTSGTGKIQIN